MTQMEEFTSKAWRTPAKVDRRWNRGDGPFGLKFMFHVSKPPTTLFWNLANGLPPTSFLEDTPCFPLNSLLEFYFLKPARTLGPSHLFWLPVQGLTWTCLLASGPFCSDVWVECLPSSWQAPSQHGISQRHKQTNGSHLLSTLSTITGTE